MDTHKNARLTPKGREEMVLAVVDRGMSNAAAARQFNTTPKTVGRWVGHFCAEGVDGLRDRSSRPLSSPSQIALATADAVVNLRRERRTQEHIAAEIGWGWTSASARPSMDEGIRCQKAATSIFSPARDRSPSPKFTDERSLWASFDQP